MISTILFDMNDVLCRYSREVRVARLARDCVRTPSFVEDAVWASGYEDLGERRAMNIDAYLSGFAERLGGTLTLNAWIGRLAGRAGAAPGSLGPRGRASGSDRILTNNNLLVAREIDSIFPELRPIFGDNILTLFFFFPAGRELQAGWIAAGKWIAGWPPSG